MISILIFILILGILILVHEFGHFIVAKFFNIRVDEFGVGYPPRAAKLFIWRGTVFTLNWLPFGGFVKIFGENGEGNADDAADAVSAAGSNPQAQITGNTGMASVAQGGSFMNKPRIAQALVLVAGVTFNLIFAWLLISVGFMIGLPTSTSSTNVADRIQDPKLVITLVAPNSPALEAGLKSGDVITAITAGNNFVEPAELSPESVSEFIAQNGEREIEIAYTRGEDTGEVSVTPAAGILDDRKAVGISMDMVGIVSLPAHLALWEGGKTTLNLTKLTAVGLGQFIYNAFSGKSDLSEVTGPVGIVGLVGDASELGFIYLLSFTAFISINLAVINLAPFPALDGGRLLVVVIEAIRRRAISPQITNVLNLVGFVLLIGLMIVVTVQDILKLTS
jgi:regulator of sigma E protease